MGTTNQRGFVKTTDEDQATELMRSRNRAAKRGEPFVIVDGPGDGEFTVMPLRDAVDGGFLYRWES